MKEEFFNNVNTYLEFTDKGITYKSVRVHWFFPYGSIDKIKFRMFNAIDIGGGQHVFTFCYMSQDKARLKSCIAYAESKMKTAVRAEVVVMGTNKTTEEKESAFAAEMNKEIRMKCNVCGHIFCYTKIDLINNQNKSSLAQLSSIASAASAIGGTRYDMYEQSKIADKYNSEIVDYSRCPSCNSTNLVQLSDNELSTPSQNTSSSTFSPTDEIKKYKELLDSGIITQSEFDEKKKQLLGL